MQVVDLALVLFHYCCELATVLHFLRYSAALFLQEPPALRRDLLRDLREGEEADLLG